MLKRSQVLQPIYFRLWVDNNGGLQLFLGRLHSCGRQGSDHLGIEDYHAEDGLTLTWADFGRIFQRPGSVFAGVSLQFLVMPSLGWE